MEDTTDRGTTATAEVSLRPAVPWLVGMLAVGVLAVVVGVVRLDALPDPYPAHFGPAGDPDRFTDRSPGSVLMPTVVGQLAGLAVFATLLVLRTSGPRRLVVPLSVMGFVVGGGIAGISVVQYLSEDAVPPGWTFWLLVAGLLATTVWVVVASVRAGRESEADRTGWRWGGLVYANPDDPDIFVTKRLGTGTTLNLGRPLGWLVLALLLVPGLVIVAVVVRWT